MSRIINYKGNKIDFDEVNYIKAITKKYPNGLVYNGSSFIGTDKANHSKSVRVDRYGEDFDFYEDNKFIDSVKYNSDLPIFCLPGYVFNLEKVNSCLISVDDKKGNFCIQFKDGTTVDCEQRLYNFYTDTIVKFSGSIELNRYKGSDLDVEKDLSNVHADIIVETDSSINLESGSAEISKAIYDELKHNSKNYPEGIRVIEKPNEELDSNEEIWQDSISMKEE